MLRTTSAASRLLGVLALATILVGSTFGYVALQSLSSTTPGTIAIWSGTISNIPAGWLLCDGSNGTPDLRGRFLEGAAVGASPGAMGGADSHSHTELSAGDAHTHILESAGAHQHTTSSSGSHNHNSILVSTGSSGSVSVIGQTNDGAHTHTTDISGAHTHTTTSATFSHTHVIDSADGRPPYYEVLFIQATESAVITPGIIIIWTGLRANIPSGWAECDGNDGRPNLQNRFLRGAPAGQNAGATGGSATHTHTEQSAGSHTHVGATTSGGDHYHTIPAYSATHTHGGVSLASGDTCAFQPHNFAHTHTNTDTIGAHTHTVATGGAHTHTIEQASSLPTYYDVIYIYCTSASSIPVGGIMIWAGSLASIPSQYALCDGSSSRPDLRTRFTRGAAFGVEAGGTGGSNSHTHIDDPQTHTHTQDTFSGTHTHASTNVAGAHRHAGPVTVAVTAGAKKFENNAVSSGGHSHSFFSFTWTHTHTVSSAGSHQHVINLADTRPSYYEVVFICATNNPPDAPTLSLPVANYHFNPSASVTFSWSFSDPNAGDYQTAYQFQLDNDSDFLSPTTDSNKVSSVSQQTAQTLPSTVGLYYWRVKTWDSKDAEGPYCTGRAIIVDRIKTTACGILNNVVDTRTGGSVYYRAVYEYDNTPFTSTCGTLYLNEKAMNWTDKWTYAFPYEMSGSQAVFIITSVAETNYGLTAFNNVAGNIVLNWATMEINISKP